MTDQISLPTAPGLWFLDAERFAWIEKLSGGRLAVGAWKGVCDAKYVTLGTREIEELPRGNWTPAQPSEVTRHVPTAPGLWTREEDDWHIYVNETCERFVDVSCQFEQGSPAWGPLRQLPRGNWTPAQPSEVANARSNAVMACPYEHQNPPGVCMKCGWIYGGHSDEVSQLQQQLAAAQAEQQSLIEFLKKHNLNPADYHVDFADGVRVIIASLMANVERLKAKLAEAKAELPATFYSDRDLAERTRLLVAHWRRMYGANHRLEAKLAEAERLAQSERTEREVEIANNRTAGGWLNNIEYLESIIVALRLRNRELELEVERDEWRRTASRWFVIPDSPDDPHPDEVYSQSAATCSTNSRRITRLDEASEQAGGE